MIEGTLIVNFDPPFIGFSSPKATKAEIEGSQLRRYCSLEEIRLLLIDLDCISEYQAWPPRELILRLPVNLPKKVLEKLNLIEIAVLKKAS